MSEMTKEGSDFKAWADKLQAFRFNDSFHLGFGDVRLARGDGDDLMRLLMQADAIAARLKALEEAIIGAPCEEDGVCAHCLNCDCWKADILDTVREVEK